MIETLQEQGVIRTPSAETKKAFFHARWEIVQDALDLDVPHTLVDFSKSTGADSALRRLKNTRLAEPAYADQLKKVSDTELRLDALMLLLAVYRHTAMRAFGGLNPNCIRRTWEVKSQSAKLGGIRWGAEPDHKNASVAYTWFMGESLEHAARKTGKKTEVGDELKNRFWNAWNTIRKTGLVYEAVALYDVAPESNDKARLRMTLRVNDYHAGAAVKTGDPSLLRSLETLSGTRFAFYTPPQNDREEPEAMWVVLPDKRGAIVGVWRPRFRPSNSDVGGWIDQENEAIESIIQAIEAAAPLDSPI